MRKSNTKSETPVTAPNIDVTMHLHTPKRHLHITQQRYSLNCTNYMSMWICLSSSLCINVCLTPEVNNALTVSTVVHI